MNKIKIGIKKYWKEMTLLFLALAATTTFACFVIIQKNSNRIYSVNDTKLSALNVESKVGIVFGGGVSEIEPLPLLKDRLDTSKELLDSGYINKLILSGDNRTLSYNEPVVMYNYLVENLKVDPDKLELDYAGRSTYETCERAKKVFGISDAYLISESTHLPRAIYLCKHFGIDAFGIDSSGESSKGLQLGQRWREILARNKAVFNIYLIGEETILGDPIDIN
jgi:vancomycin permeability regulator SanA